MLEVSKITSMEELEKFRLKCDEEIKKQKGSIGLDERKQYIVDLKAKCLEVLYVVKALQDFDALEKDIQGSKICSGKGKWL